MFLDDVRLKKVLDGIIPMIESKKSIDEILEMARDRLFENFQSSGYMTSMRCGTWNRIKVEFNTIIFFMQGKILMECYDDFMFYIENLIKKSSKYRISGSVKAFID